MHLVYNINKMILPLQLLHYVQKQHYIYMYRSKVWKNCLLLQLPTIHVNIHKNKHTYRVTYSTQYSIGTKMLYSTSYQCCSGYQQVTSSPLTCQRKSLPFTVYMFCLCLVHSWCGLSLSCQPKSLSGSFLSSSTVCMLSLSMVD